MSRRFLRRTLPAFAAVLALGVTGLPAATAAHSASQPAKSCAVSIGLPSKVVIDRPYREVKVTLNDPCKRVSSAYSSLYGKNGLEEAFMFTNGKRTEYWDVYDYWVAPGAYKTRDTWAYDKNYDDVRVKEASTKAKYGSRAGLSSSRNGTKVTLSVDVTSWSPVYETFRPWTASKVVIQKKSGSTWAYVRTVPMKSGKGSISVSSKSKATYRAVVSEDWARWGSTSKTTTR